MFSGVVEFLSNGRVSVSHLDFKEIDYEQVLNAFSHTKDKDSLTHAFNLKNAYDDSIMDFTNYTCVSSLPASFLFAVEFVQICCF